MPEREYLSAYELILLPTNSWVFGPRGRAWVKNYTSRWDVQGRGPRNVMSADLVTLHGPIRRRV